jgi:4'-phosphopantetheinyl transferase
MSRYPAAVRGLPPMIDVTFVPAIAGDPPWVPLVLDPDELSRWTALHDTGRPLFLAAHVGARMLAARRLAWASDPPAGASDLGDFGWTTSASGKPSLTFRDGRAFALHISVTHGGGMAGAAVCDHGPIGIDVEHIDTRRNLLGIARRFFSPEEHAVLAACSPDERLLRFHQWWTRKEAVLKAVGTGLRGGLTVRVDAAPDDNGWRCVWLTGHDAPLYVHDLRTPDPAVLGAIAIEGQPGVVQSVDTWMAHEEGNAAWT